MPSTKDEHKIDLINDSLTKFKTGFSSFFTYSTTRSATIKSYKIGITYRIVQFFLFYYIVGYLDDDFILFTINFA